VITRIEAPAKLTLSLHIVGTREDGYHLIDAEMASLSLCDNITVRTASHSSVTMTGKHSGGIPTNANNLVMKALDLTGASAAVTIEKNIPAGGGLGGGSTNAAAILRWQNFDDLDQAAQIGADLPFCIVGGRARVTGIGEIVTPLQFEPCDITLIIPPLHISTPAVYRMWDDLGGPHHESGNDLEPAAIAVNPRLDTWKQHISEVCGIAPTLAGSGATWFVRGHHRELDRLSDATVVYTKTRPDAGHIAPA